MERIRRALADGWNMQTAGQKIMMISFLGAIVALALTDLVGRS